jgi:hypothetical protein
VVGALLTVCICTAILGFAIQKFVLMFMMVNPSVNSYNLMINLTDPDGHKIQLGGSDFQIAFGLAEGIILPPSIGYFEASYTIKVPKSDSNGSPGK